MTINLAMALVGALLFVCGAVCMATKRNAVGILMGVELVLNAANLNFVGFSLTRLPDGRIVYSTFGLDGHIVALFVIVLAAAEAAIALAIILNFYNNFLSVDVDRGKILKG